MHGEKLTARQFARAKGWHKYFGNPCKEHGRVQRYVSNGCCTKCQKDTREEYREKEERKFPESYYSGMRARSRGYEKIPPSNLESVNNAWWLAGWHDKDIEANGRKTFSRR